jgi:hypothetical protein
LTALGLSEKRLAHNDLVVLSTLTTASDEPKRSANYDARQFLEKSIPEKEKVLLRTIKIGRLGVDISDTKKNPLFPFEEFRNTEHMFEDRR